MEKQTINAETESQKIEISEVTASLIYAKAELDVVYQLVENATEAMSELREDREEMERLNTAFVGLWEAASKVLIDAAQKSVAKNMENFNFIV